MSLEHPDPTRRLVGVDEWTVRLYVRADADDEIAEHIRLVLTNTLSQLTSALDLAGAFSGQFGLSAGTNP